MVKTEFAEAGGMDPTELQKFGEHPMSESKDVADAVVYVLSTPPHVQVHIFHSFVFEMQLNILEYF